MNPSASSFVYTATDPCSSTSTVSHCASAQSYYPFVEYTPSVYEDSSSESSARDWTIERIGCSDTYRALFEAFFKAEAASTISMQSPPSYDPQSSFVHHPTEAAQAHAQHLDVLWSYPCASTSSQSNIPPVFNLAPRETAASPASLDLMYPPSDDDYVPEECYSVAGMSQCSHSAAQPWFPPSPSSSPEPWPETSTCVVTVSPQRSVPAHTRHSPASLALESSLPDPVSQDLIYPSTYYRYGLSDDYSTYLRVPNRRAPAAAQPVAAHPPLPIPPLPHCRPDLPASNAWQCPHCPYVQRNRRSPDLKRHIKTHTRGADGADWVCCGVPVLNAIELGVPATIVREARVFELDGVLMIGGCRKAFSRRDALSRHLQRERGKCFGDALSLHQRGNRESC
ncbi:hypothetical protein GSI_14318 [Ganoderma sinense ZZ0214-1]|uniref:Uncharacterized protein n=1 Tax=Ganoderma sinense ZZ0214-1 TaxID=1077348 RepID=A0A2G8RND3_9APHY|nr:hypothetical protein GSI_14318 [Ganoderma sinense ZZ0214-1]